MIGSAPVGSCLLYAKKENKDEQRHAALFLRAVEAKTVTLFFIAPYNLDGLTVRPLGGSLVAALLSAF